MTVFDAHRQAGLGSPTEATEGPNFDVFKLATAATENFVDRIDAIRGDPDLSDVGKAAAIAKEQAARAPGLADAARRLKKESADLDALVHEQHAFAGLTSPAEDSATELRAIAIRSQFAAMSPSDRLQAIHGGSAEVARALYHSFDFGTAPLLDARSREVIEDRLLSAANKERHAAIAIRRADHARARAALESATAFVNRGRLPQAGVRERLDAKNESNK
jgi:hypothetical protein